MALSSDNIRFVFWMAVVPAFISLAIMAFGSGNRPGTRLLTSRACAWPNLNGRTLDPEHRIDDRQLRESRREFGSPAGQVLLMPPLDS